MGCMEDGRSIRKYTCQCLLLYLPNSFKLDMMTTKSTHWRGNTRICVCLKTYIKLAVQVGTENSSYFLRFLKTYVP